MRILLSLCILFMYSLQDRKLYKHYLIGFSKMNNWRDKVSKDISDHLEAQINESTKYKEAYESASNKGQAQLWTAIATLSKQIFDLNLKINYLEGVLREFDKKIKESGEEIEKSLKESKEDVKKSLADAEKEMEDFVKKMPKIEEEVKEIKTETKPIKREEKPTIRTVKIKRIKKSASLRKLRKGKTKKISRKKPKKKSLARVLRRF